MIFRLRYRAARIVCSALFFACAVRALGAQLPKQPKNLQVLPKNLSTDSVEKVMLGVANALGYTCGSCHPGGDNATWDSTNFSTDVKPMKVTAREMFRLVNRLNNELLPPIVNRGTAAVRITCATCHRGAPRPVTIQDTLNNVIERQGVDSAIAQYQRIREGYAGRMTYDLTEFPLGEIASRLRKANRLPDAIKLLELNAKLFPSSADVAYDLGRTYEAAGQKQKAISQFYRALGLDPDQEAAQRHLRALTDQPKPPASSLPH